MKIQSLKIILTGLLLSILPSILLIQPARSEVVIAQQIAPNPENNIVLFYRGVWVGTYANVGSQGRVQMYIDPSEQLHGSLVSNDGEDFAQISGYHRGNEFHMVFTPPPGARNQFGEEKRVEVDATAKWDGSPGRLLISTRTSTGHTQRYEFERAKVN